MLPSKNTQSWQTGLVVLKVYHTLNDRVEYFVLPTPHNQVNRGILTTCS
jgi:hypothetical protein